MTGFDVSAVRTDSDVSSRPLSADRRWRVGEHYSLHVYQGDRPVATFHDPDDAALAVQAVNAASSVPLSADRRCGFAVVDRDGEQEPCDRPATGWRWYQNEGEHEDLLDVACSYHENEGGRRIAAAERRLNAVRELAENAPKHSSDSQPDWRQFASITPAQLLAVLDTTQEASG